MVLIGKSFLSSRDVLWYIVFCGFAVNYMLRINLNIAIVSMVATRAPLVTNGAEFKANLRQTSECLINDSISSSLNETEKFNYNMSETTDTKIAEEPIGFEWDENQQGVILGAFYWLHWLTQVPAYSVRFRDLDLFLTNVTALGGILARRYGTKLVFGLANVLGCVCCFAIPFASYLDFRALIFIRALQGFLTGFSWPAMHNMTAKWIPPNERSKFVSAYLGSSVGAALTFPLCGYIISWSSWEAVFHVCGIIGVIWYIAWLFLVFDSPAEHPRIDPDEKEYIEKSLGHTVGTQSASTPWRAILTSSGVWMNVIAQWGGIWGLFTLMTQAPTYFKQIHGWNIRMTGMLSGMPHILRMAFAYVFSLFGDYLLRTNRMSRSNVRKMATAVSCILQGMFLVALAYSDCNWLSAIIFMTAATAVHGAVSTGPLASLVDLGPNYASITLGISGMITVIPGFISPAIVGALTYNNQTIGQWQKVFLLAAGMLIISGVVYVMFSESTLQPWNNPGVVLDETELSLTMLGNPKNITTDDIVKENNQTEKLLDESTHKENNNKTINVEPT